MNKEIDVLQYKLLENAFNAGREYHDPGHHIPMLRWKTYKSWVQGLETHMEYGKTLERPAR